MLLFDYHATQERDDFTIGQVQVGVVAGEVVVAAAVSTK